jgi:hypothetical protein
VGEREGLTEYLVYCPSLSATNILTHIIPKDSAISFIQQIGNTKNKYPQAIGINGNNMFGLATPNMVIAFNYNDGQESSRVSP